MTLEPSLVSALQGIAGTPALLVATDFDGVLAPLVLDPMQSTPLPGTIESLTGLAALGDTYAAVVSGRDLQTLTLLTGLGDSAVTRIGSHGGESSERTGPALTEAQRRLLDSLVDDLGAVTGTHAGSRIELKPTAAVLHTRGMDEAAAREAEAAALEVAGRHTDLHVLHGKHVVELAVVRADKGTALLALRDAVGASALVYFGDDVTDEDVFRVLGDHDAGVKVGAGESAAGFRVARPEDAAEALALLLELRTAACHTVC